MGSGPEINAESTRARAVAADPVKVANDAFTSILDYAFAHNANAARDALVNFTVSDKNYTKRGVTITGGPSTNPAVKTDGLFTALGIDQKAKEADLKAALAASLDTKATQKRRDKLPEYNIVTLMDNLVKKKLVSAEKLNEILANYKKNYQITNNDIASFVRSNQDFTKLGNSMNSGNQIRAFQKWAGSTRASDSWYDVLNRSDIGRNKSNPALREHSVNVIASAYTSSAYDTDGIKGDSRAEFTKAVTEFSTPSANARAEQEENPSNAA